MSTHQDVSFILVKQPEQEESTGHKMFLFCRHPDVDMIHAAYLARLAAGIANKFTETH